MCPCRTVYGNFVFQAHFVHVYHTERQSIARSMSVRQTSISGIMYDINVSSRMKAMSAR